jgi:hypothetical protein
MYLLYICILIIKHIIFFYLGIKIISSFKASSSKASSSKASLSKAPPLPVVSTESLLTPETPGFCEMVQGIDLTIINNSLALSRFQENLTCRK